MRGADTGNELQSRVGDQRVLLPFSPSLALRAGTSSGELPLGEPSQVGDPSRSSHSAFLDGSSHPRSRHLRRARARSWTRRGGGKAGPLSGRALTSRVPGRACPGCLSAFAGQEKSRETPSMGKHSKGREKKKSCNSRHWLCCHPLPFICCCRFYFIVLEGTGWGLSRFAGLWGTDVIFR